MIELGHKSIRSDQIRKVTEWKKNLVGVFVTATVHPKLIICLIETI